MTPPKAVGLVLNSLDVLIETPAEIIANCSLRRPTEAELARFKERLANIDLRNSVERAFEYSLPSSPGPGIMVNLPPGSWRYWVVEEIAGPDIIGVGLENVCMISRLCRAELPCGNFVLYPHLILDPKKLPMRISSMIGCDPFLPLLHSVKPKRFDSEALKQIQDVWGTYEALGTAFPSIRSAVETYWRLGSLWTGINLYPLGVFGVMESVLTHDPQGNYDSLRHQLAAKMLLLGKRFGNPLDYSWFPELNPTKVWKALYDYRCVLAHGGTPEFDGKLKGLKGSLEVVGFLDLATKELLTHALKEPQLITDLQKC